MKSESLVIADQHAAVNTALQLEHMKLESLVIADQHAAVNTNQHVAVNTFPGLVHTARQSRKWIVLEVVVPTARRQTPKV